MSAHRIIMELRSKHRRGEPKYLAVAGAPEDDGKIDLDELTAHVCEALRVYADNPAFVRPLLEGFVQESWEEYCEQKRRFHDQG
jgi:hypothetical protein